MRLLAMAGTVGTVISHPAVRLHPFSVGTRETPVEVVKRFREQLGTDGEVVVAGDDRIVARFAGRAGMFRYRTVEVVVSVPAASTSSISGDHSETATSGSGSSRPKAAGRW